MKKTLAVLAIATTLAATALSTPAEARRGRIAAGIFAGIAAGALLSGALYPRYYYYEPAPVFIEPDCYWARERVWISRYRWRWRRLRVCD